MSNVEILPPPLFRTRGPVYEFNDPITGNRSYGGTHVSRAARIELQAKCTRVKLLPRCLPRNAHEISHATTLVKCRWPRVTEFCRCITSVGVL